MSDKLTLEELAREAKTAGTLELPPQNFLIFLSGDVGGDKIQSTVKDSSKIKQTQEHKDLLIVYSMTDYHTNELNKTTQMGTPRPVGLTLSLPLYSSCVPGFLKALYTAKEIPKLTLILARHDREHLTEVASLEIEKSIVGSVIFDTNAAYGPTMHVSLLAAGQKYVAGGKEFAQKTQTS